MNGDPTVTALDAEKQAWVKSMRLKFCRRPDMPLTQKIIDDEGNLQKEYFTARVEKKKERVWGEEQKQLLIQGISKYGVGFFDDISKNLLNDWTPNELRIKTIRLMGRQNLSLYKGWKGDAAAIEEEFEFNKEIGLQFGTWKGGVLVSDDDGKVNEHLNKKPYKNGRNLLK
eukprot:Colp12_sorted_trinity150504_noHs@12585